jgi:transketolase
VVRSRIGSRDCISWLAGENNPTKEVSMSNSEDVAYLKAKARELRCHILRMIHKAKSGHPGGSLSAADIVTALYFRFLRIDPGNPSWPDRDRFILSKGHACPVLYAALAMRGYYPLKVLDTLRELGSPLQGHPSMKACLGVDITTGSLGNGLSAGIGMALAGKLDEKDYRVYVMLGDGELDEGIVWEAALCANKFRLDNLTAIVDYNNLQLDGTVEEIMPLEPVTDKWRSFGWHVFDIDGNDMEAVCRALPAVRDIKDSPCVIIARTVKGKGVSFMENEVDWHGRAPDDQQLAEALRELEAGG